MRVTRMAASRRWWVPRVTAGTAAVVVLAGLASGAGAGSSAPTARSHAGTAVRHALDAAAMRYHGVIGAPPSAVETGAQAVAPPPLDMTGYNICANPPPGQGGSWQQGAAFLAGWSNASKLGGAAVLGSPNLGLADGNSSNQPTAGDGVAPLYTPTASNGVQYTCAQARLQLDYHGQREFPPLRATFLGFRFVPVTATVHLTQAGSAPVTTILYTPNSGPAPLPNPAPTTAVTIAEMSLRLSDVTVNGVPVDVGSNCHTVGSLTSPNPINHNELVLTGGTQLGDPLPFFGTPGLGILGGGAMAGVVTIPPFTGCVTPGGDNLNALLDATVSGPGNYTRVVVGGACTNNETNVTAPSLCSAVPGVPEQQPVWTVIHGTGGGGRTATASPECQFALFPSGQVVTAAVCLQTASSGLTITGSPGGYFIACTGSSIRATVPDASGPLRDGALGSVTWTGFSGCAGYSEVCPASVFVCFFPQDLQQQADGSRWTITQQGTAFLDGIQYFPGNNPPTTAATTLNTDDVVFTLTGMNVPVTPGSSTTLSCAAQLTQSIPGPQVIAGGTNGGYSNSGSALTIGASVTIGESTGAGLLVAKSTCPSGAATGLSLAGGPGITGEPGFAVPPEFSATYHLGGTIITSP